MAKKILFVTTKAPYGTSYAREALDAVLMASAFGQEISLLFLNDGIYQLKKEQAPADGHKNISAAFPALELYDVHNVYVDNKSLSERNLEPDDLVISTKTLNDESIKDLMASQDQILNF